MSDNVATVAGIYEAFGRRDINTLLNALADDVQWENHSDNYAQKAGVPWMQHRVGKDAVLGFFQVIGEWDFKSFEVVSLLAGGNKVAAQITFQAVLPNGFILNGDDIHLWTFNDAGQVSAYRHYSDTAKFIAAAKA